MIAAPSINAVRDALAPVEALRGEHSELESSVRESFAALDALHGELSEWQRELTRQQAALDQREAGLSDLAGRPDAELVEKIRAKLAQVSEESRQLEEENAEQLQAIDDLDRQLAVSQTELRLVRKHSDELALSLKTEREQGADEHQHWTSELKELRRLMERQGAMLCQLAGADAECVETDAATGPLADEVDGPLALSSDVSVRTAELRRRAKSRRVHRPSA